MIDVNHLSILDDDDTAHLYMKAEVLRELQMWQRAEEVLVRIKSSDFSEVVGQLRALCRAKDARVRKLKLGA